MLSRKPGLWEKFLPSGGQLADVFAAAVSDGHMREAVVELQPEALEERRKRRPEGAVAPVLGLQSDSEAVLGGGAEQAFGTALGDPAGECPHQIGVGLPGAADQLRLP